MPKLSPKEVRERTEDIFEPVILVNKLTNKIGTTFVLSVLDYQVWVKFSLAPIEGEEFFPGTNIISMEIYNKESRGVFSYGYGGIVYRVKGVPLQKIVKKLVRFWEEQKKNEKAGDLTS